MNRAKFNYVIDVVIALEFIASGISGLIFLLPPEILSIEALTVWDQIHTWSSLALIAGGLLHVVLHLKWISVMTTRTFSLKSAEMSGSSRRSFLVLTGLVAALITLTFASIQAVFRANLIEGDNSGLALNLGGAFPGREKKGKTSS